MASKFELTAQKRTDEGKGASRRLRRKDLVPAVIYGDDMPSESITLSHVEFSHALKNEATYSHVLTIMVDGRPEKAILRDLQRHPVKPRLLHADFQRVSKKQKMHFHVPLHFTGEEDAPGIRLEEGVLIKHIAELELTCLADKLPEFISIDVSKMNIDDSIHLSQIKLPDGVELTHPIHDHEHDHPVVGVIAPRVVVEEEIVVEEEVAPEEGAETEEAAKEGKEGKETKAGKEGKESKPGKEGKSKD